MWSSSRRAICCPNDTHIARFPARSQSCTARDSRNFGSYQDLVYSAAISRVSFAFQSPAFPFPPCTQRSKHPSEPLRLRRIQREWNIRNWQTEQGINLENSPSPARRDGMDAERSVGGKMGHKKTRNKAKSARPARKEMDSKSKSDNLVCRYCGSDDLAPSFIKRRDRRCRKCFSKRYGSASRARKVRIKK
jgi:hypothetical protein